MDLEIIKAVASGAVAGGGTAMLAVRSWVKRMEQKASQVESHETRLGKIEAALGVMADTLKAHTANEENSFNEIKSGLARLVSELGTMRGDVGFVRGWIAGKDKE